MIEVTILVPVVVSDGHTFAAPHHAQFEAFLTEHFGGFTRLPGTAVGAWVDRATGQTYRDSTILYMVAVEGLVGSGGPLLGAASFAKAHYRQEAILLRYLGVAEII